jgi:hypothetical protein
MRDIGNVLFRLKWLGAATLLLLAINNSFSDQFDHLTPRFSGTSASLNSIAYGTNVYVAVGAGGLVLKSPDSATWFNQISPTTNELRGVAFANGLFVAVGGSGTIITSPDGISWTAQTSGVTNRLNAIASSGVGFVAVGDSGAILYSTNAVNWQSIFTGVPYNLNGIVGGGSFIAVGDSGTLLTSSGGLGWTVRSSGTLLNLGAVARSINPSGAFAAVGQSGVVITSSDGVTWTVGYTGITTDLHAIAIDPAGYYSGTILRNGPIGTFGVAGDGGIFITSSDGGQTWTSQATETTNNLRGITFENGGFVCVGNSGTIQAGFVWVSRASGVGNTLDSITYGQNKFVSVGVAGTILTSTNGKDWILCNAGTTASLSEIIFANNIFVAVGANDSVISTNGLDWSAHIVFTSTSSTNFTRVAYGNGTFVALASFLQEAYGPAYYVSEVLLSTDGINWTTSFVFPSSFPMSDLAFGTNLFCVAGSGGLYTSPDGVNWTQQNSNGSAGFVNYCGGRFIAGGLYSTDGTNWTPYSSGYFYARPCYANNAFVAAGGSFETGHNNPGSAYQTSSDGINWTSRGPNSLFETPPVFNGIAFGNGTFVAVGAGGLIVQSVPAPSLVSASPASQGIKINLTGNIGRNFVLETTTNLSAASWTTLFSVTNAPYSTNFIDVMTNIPQRFYRSREP